MAKRTNPTATKPAMSHGVQLDTPDKTRIATLAYDLWVERGCPAGSDQEDWFRAERLLKERGKAAAKAVTARA